MPTFEMREATSNRRSSEMNLPPPIQAYFEADERSDGEALIQAFASDASRQG